MSEDPTLVVVAAYQDLEAARADFAVVSAKVAAKELADARHDPGVEGRGRQRARGRHRQPPRSPWRRLGRGVGLSSGCSRRRCWPRSRSARRPGRSSGTSPVTSSPDPGPGGRGAQGRHRPSSSACSRPRTGCRRAGAAGSPLKSVVESDQDGIDELKDALAEAMGKFNPDRTVLPIATSRSAAWPGARRTTRCPTGASSPGRRRPRTRRTCCSCSSTTPASADPTPSAVGSARRT